MKCSQKDERTYACSPIGNLVYTGPIANIRVLEIPQK